MNSVSVKMLYLLLGIVTGGDQQVSQDQQLVICELLLMLLPVVMVSPPKVRQSFLHSHLEGHKHIFWLFFHLLFSEYF